MKKLILLMSALMLTGCAQLSVESDQFKASYTSVGKRELKNIQITRTGDAWTASMESAASKSEIDQRALLDIIKLGVLK